MKLSKASVTTSPVFLIRNYNLFLMKGKYGIKWTNLYIHRFRHDLVRMVIFGSVESAKKFLKQNPELESNFDAWILEVNLESWDNTYKQCSTGKRVEDKHLWNTYENFIP